MNFSFCTSGHPTLLNLKDENSWFKFGCIGAYGKNLKIYEEKSLEVKNFIQSDCDIIFAKQNHSNIVLTDYEEKNNGPYDAILINKPKIAAVIKTADCIPLVIVNKSSSLLAVIHAGWRGALAGIVQNAILKAGNPKDIFCIIGPCIRSYSYEVGVDVMDLFSSQSIKNNIFFTAKKNGKFYFDLVGYVKNLLVELYVDKNKIYDCKIDTYLNYRSFFSYRKSCHIGDGLEKMRNITYAYFVKDL